MFDSKYSKSQPKKSSTKKKKVLKFEDGGSVPERSTKGDSLLTRKNTSRYGDGSAANPDADNQFGSLMSRSKYKNPEDVEGDTSTVASTGKRRRD